MVLGRSNEKTFWEITKILRLVRLKYLSEKIFLTTKYICNFYYGNIIFYYIAKHSSVYKKCLTRK